MMGQSSCRWTIQGPTLDSHSEPHGKSALQQSHRTCVEASTCHTYLVNLLQNMFQLDLQAPALGAHLMGGIISEITPFGTSTKLDSTN